MTTTICTNCGAVFQIADHLLGTRVKCKKCNTSFEPYSLQKNIASSLPPPLPWSNVPKTAPMPSDRWYYSQNKTRVGPVSLSQLRRLQLEGVLKPEDMVLQEGTQKWRPLASVTATESGSKRKPGDNLPIVLAHRSSPTPKGSRRMHAGWLVAAFAAFMVPILTASILSFWRLAHAGRPAASSSNSKLAYAGIEIGSNGPRYCVVEFLPEGKGGDNYRVVAYASTAAEVMRKSGSLNQDELPKTISAVHTFYDRLVKDHKIPPDQIVIVSSETLFGRILERRDVDQPEKDRQIHQCRDSLSAAVKKATGQTMEFVSLTKVAEHQLKAVVRKSDLKDAVFLDIGGESTRGAYCDAADLIQAAEGPGIKGFISKVKGVLLDEDDFTERAKAMAEQHLREPVRTTLGKDPEFTARNKIYLAGGIAWVMANCEHPSNTNDYVHLTTADIEAFTAKVLKKPDLLTTIQPDPSLSPERQEWLKREYARMRSAFKSPERLVAGAEILSALSTELRFAGRDIWFYRHSDFAWVASYIEATRRPRK